MTTQKVLSSLCLALSFPLCLLYLPWLPGTVGVHFEILKELQFPGGTFWYYHERQAALHRNDIALALYALSVFALVGLVGIAQHRCTGRSQRLVWLATCVAGMGFVLFYMTDVSTAEFGPPEVHSQTTVPGWLLSIGLPVAIAIVALFGLVASFVQPREPFLPDRSSA